MDYEHEQVFPKDLHDWSATLQMTDEDMTIYRRYECRSKKYYSADKRDGYIMAALANARAKGVIPKMQPLDIWLRNAE